MIPKRVHFTWFGTDPYPPIVRRCIQSWKEKLPGYEIILWNTDNFDMNMNEWIRQAYNAKKYAFVSDFARFYLCYTYGGIYLDSDIRILQDLEPLLQNKAFCSVLPFTHEGLEAEIIGAEAGHPIFKEMMDYYKDRQFIQNDDSYSYDLKPLNYILYELFLEKGYTPNGSEQIIRDVHIYPEGYFLWSGIDYIENASSPTAYSVHHAQYSWKENCTGFEKIYQILSRNYNLYEKEIWDISKQTHTTTILQKIRKIYQKHRNKK